MQIKNSFMYWDYCAKYYTLSWFCGNFNPDERSHCLYCYSDSCPCVCAYICPTKGFLTQRFVIWKFCKTLPCEFLCQCDYFELINMQIRHIRHKSMVSPWKNCAKKLRMEYTSEVTFSYKVLLQIDQNSHY